MIRTNSIKIELNEKEWEQLLGDEVCLDPNCKGNLVAYNEGIQCSECEIVYIPNSDVKNNTRRKVRVKSELFSKYGDITKNHSYK